MDAWGNEAKNRRWLAACAAAASGGTFTLTAGVLHAFTGQNAFFARIRVAAASSPRRPW
jgi:hypothetical protein